MPSGFCARIGLRHSSETLVGFDSDLLGKKGIIHLSPNGCQALSSFILIYSYYSFCLEYWNNSETLVGDEMIKVLEKDNVTFTRQCLLCASVVSYEFSDLKMRTGKNGRGYFAYRFITCPICKKDIRH